MQIIIILKLKKLNKHIPTKKIKITIIVYQTSTQNFERFTFISIYFLTLQHTCQDISQVKSKLDKTNICFAKQKLHSSNSASDSKNL